jgi:hypothetical protein
MNFLKICTCGEGSLSELQCGLASETGKNHNFDANRASLLIVQASVQVGSLG